MFKIILLILITINIFADSKVSGEFGREEARLIFDKNININNVSIKINNRALDVKYNSTVLYSFTTIRFNEFVIIGKDKELNTIKLKLQN